MNLGHQPRNIGYFTENQQSGTVKGQWRDKKVIREYLETDGDETHCIKMRGTLKVVPRLHMQGEL